MVTQGYSMAKFFSVTNLSLYDRIFRLHYLLYYHQMANLHLLQPCMDELSGMHCSLHDFFIAQLP